MPATWSCTCAAASAGTSYSGDGIKAGRYRIAPGQTPLSILRQLTDGKVVLEQVTVIEG